MLEIFFSAIIVLILLLIFLNIRLQNQWKNFLLLLIVILFLLLEKFKLEFSLISSYFKAFLFLVVFSIFLNFGKNRSLKRNLFDIFVLVFFISIALLIVFLFNSSFLDKELYYTFNFFWHFLIAIYIIFSLINLFYYREEIKISLKERLLVISTLVITILIFAENFLLEGLYNIFNNFEYFSDIYLKSKNIISSTTYLMFSVSVFYYIFNNEYSKIKIIIENKKSKERDVDLLTIIKELAIKSEEIESIVESIINLSNFLISPDGIIIYLYDKDRDAFVAKGIYGYVVPPFYVNDRILSDSQKLFETIKKTEVKLNNPIFSVTIKDNGFFFMKTDIHDISREYIKPLRDYAARFGSLLVGTFNIDKEIGGFLYFHNRITDFNELNIKAFKSLCSLVSVLISNIYAKRIAKVKERLENELQIAEKIQTSILPKKFDIEGYKICPYMKPAEEVGGDYYDIIKTTKGRFWINIGDVTGHGLTAGLIMLILQTSASTIIMNEPDIKPDELIIKTNKIIFDSIKNRLLLDQYITACFLRGDKDGNFLFAGAHEDILIYRSKGKKIERIQTVGMWLGLTEDISQIIKTGSFKLEKGDFLFVFTDGTIEIMNEKGEQYDLYRLEKFLLGNAEKEPEEIRDLLEIELNNFKAEQKDDISFVIVKKI